MMQVQKSSSTVRIAEAPDWHSRDVQVVIDTLHTDPRAGLRTAEAARRLTQDGRNTLKAMGKVPWYVVFGRQFLDGLILILLAAAAIALAIGELADAITILAIVVLNGILGFVQEWKAERAIEALQRMLSPRLFFFLENRPNGGGGAGPASTKRRSFCSTFLTFAFRSTIVRSVIGLTQEEVPSCVDGSLR